MQASLVLYQNPASRLTSYVTDREQYVEVKSAASNSTQVHTSSFLAGKLVDVFEGGFHVFDITSATKLWIMEGLQGDLELDVSVYCIHSPECGQPNNDGRLPHSVEFTQDQASLQHAPRLVISSKSPLSNTHKDRAKRESRGGGASFCTANQTTCCLKELFINFKEDLGPEYCFIVDPPSYQANYCEGVCPTTPGGELMTPMLYDFLSKLQNSPASSVTPCCAGHQYENLPILLDLEGVLTPSTLIDVSVVSCRCG